MYELHIKYFEKQYSVYCMLLRPLKGGCRVPPDPLVVLVGSGVQPETHWSCILGYTLCELGVTMNQILNVNDITSQSHGDASGAPTLQQPRAYEFLCPKRYFSIFLLHSRLISSIFLIEIWP